MNTTMTTQKSEACETQSCPTSSIQQRLVYNHNQTFVCGREATERADHHHVTPAKGYPQRQQTLNHNQTLVQAHRSRGLNYNHNQTLIRGLGMCKGEEPGC